MSGKIRRSDQYTVDEVAVIMGTDPETVRRWIRSDELQAEFTFRGAGGGFRVRHVDLERFLRNRHPYVTLDIPE